MANKLITSAMLETNKLQHHGVKGMKWGVTRTPEQLGRTSKATKVESEEIMGNLIVSLGIIGGKFILSNIGNKKVTLQADDPTLKLSKLKDAKRIKPPESYLDSIKGTNNTKSLNKSFKNNCPNTTLAYELRRRGYDIKAKPSPKGLTMSTIRELYNIKESNLMITNMSNPLKTKENNQKLKSYFESVPDGYRGAIGVSWEGGFGGHIFNVEKVNGKTMFIDSQSGTHGEFKGASLMKKTTEFAKSYASYGLLDTNPSNYLSKASSLEIFRTDNAIINETNISDRVLKG